MEKLAKETQLLAPPFNFTKLRGKSIIKKVQVPTQRKPMHTEAPLPEDNNGRSRDNSDFEFPEDLMIQLGPFIGSFSQVDLVSNFGPEIAEKLEKQKLAGGEIEKKHQQLNQEWLLDGIDESQTFVPTDQVICHVSQQLSAVNCLAVIDPLSDQDIYHDNEGNVFIVHDKVQIASIGERRQEDLSEADDASRSLENHIISSW